jgi:hypothetical protein
MGTGSLFIFLFIYLVGVFLPGIVVGKIRSLFAAAKASPWWHDPAHPKRSRWLLATAELAEDEIPEPGTGGAVYAAWGAKTASIAPFLIGTAARWAAAYEKVGDAVDLELNAQVKDLGELPPLPATPGPVAPPEPAAGPVEPPAAIPAPPGPAAPAEPPAAAPKAPAPPEA